MEAQTVVISGSAKVIFSSKTKNRTTGAEIELQKTSYNIEYPGGSEGGIMVHVYCRTHKSQSLCISRRAAEKMKHSPWLFCKGCMCALIFSPMRHQYGSR